MACNKHIDEIIEKFFLLTNIPIISFKLNGNEISSFGYNNELERLFHSHNIYERVMKEISNNKDKTSFTIPVNENLYYIGCSVCPRNFNRGIFILGPCSNIKTNNINIPFKPLKIKTYIVKLLRTLWKEHREGVKGFCNQAYNLHIRKAVDYMDSRYDEDITLADMADYLNLNKSYFSSLFKSETGMSFTEFLNKTRVEKSKKLLLEDKHSILDIALMVGFNNQNYYNIIFKKFTNQTPMEFRRNGNI